jgi:hypothetical protein
VLRLNLDVQSRDKRTVRVALRGLPVVATWSEENAEGIVELEAADVESMGALRAWLTEATRTAADGSMIEAIAWEPVVKRLFRLLQFEGPPPESFVIAVAPA